MSGNSQERRREKREEMVDISSSGAAFTCFADDSPYQGQYITTRFSVPHYAKDNSFDLENHIRSGFVSRVENISAYTRKIAIQFAQPLPFNPGEQKQNIQQPQTVEI